MHRIEIPLRENPYSILVGTQLLDDIASSSTTAIGRISHAICICDSAVASTHGNRVAKSLQADGARVQIIEVPSGEASKSPAQLITLWNAMLEHRADRGSVVFAVGGGVVGDLAGFVAASFARGVRLVQVPTTLLAQVDSSVGGKTGINLPTAKNMIGAFYQPSLVVIDVESLSTLPDREFISGLAEVVKYGAVLDAEFFEWLEQNAAAIMAREPDALQHIIATSCECKARIVLEDERETTGRRAILNYGHTFGHAIESATKYGTFLHGEAVAIGMTMAAQLAFAMGRVDTDFVKRQRDLLQQLQLPVHFDGATPDDLIRLMQNDKKVVHGKLTFILPSKLGEGSGVPDVEESLVRQSILAARS